MEKKLGMITLDVVDRTLIGNGARTLWPDFPYQILYQKAQDVTFERLAQQDRSLRSSILEAGHRLVDAGADALVGSCGLMGLFQKDFTQEFSVPCLMSSLCTIPMAAVMLGPDDKLGILTANSNAITQQLLTAVGGNSNIPIYVKGLEDKPHFFNVFFMLGRTIDTDLLKQEIVQSVKELVQEAPNVKIIVCECTVLPVYRKAIKEAGRRPIIDWGLMLDWLFQCL